MTPETSSSYFQRAVAALGQSAADSERVAIWCYDNPPHKALPKLYGERSRQVWISRRVWQCLRSLAIATNNGETQHTTDALADAYLCLAVKDCNPALWTMHERHEQEEEKLLTELRHNEPTLQAKGEA
jgi:hypothetical protein